MSTLTEAQDLIARAEGALADPATADATAAELTQLAIAKVLVTIAKRMG